jgi:hypothetical protein
MTTRALWCGRTVSPAGLNVLLTRRDVSSRSPRWLIAGLRDLAKFLDKNPGVPAPRRTDMLVFPPVGSDAEMFAEIDVIAAQIGATASDADSAGQSRSASAERQLARGRPSPLTALPWSLSAAFGSSGAGRARRSMRVPSGPSAGSDRSIRTRHPPSGTRPVSRPLGSRCHLVAERSKHWTVFTQAHACSLRSSHRLVLM